MKNVAVEFKHMHSLCAIDRCSFWHLCAAQMHMCAAFLLATLHVCTSRHVSPCASRTTQQQRHEQRGAAVPTQSNSHQWHGQRRDPSRVRTAHLNTLFWNSVPNEDMEQCSSTVPTWNVFLERKRLVRLCCVHNKVEIKIDSRTRGAACSWALVRAAPSLLRIRRCIVLRRSDACTRGRHDARSNRRSA